MFGLGAARDAELILLSFGLSADLHVIQNFAYFSENLSLLPESFKQMLATNLETELNKGVVLCINGWEGNVSIIKEKEGVSSFVNKD